MKWQPGDQDPSILLFCTPFPHGYQVHTPANGTGKREGEGASFPLRAQLGNDTFHICLSLLLEPPSWSHLPTREAGQCSFQWGSYVPS